MIFVFHLNIAGQVTWETSQLHAISSNYASVCGRDDVEYFSSCFAGCVSLKELKNEKVTCIYYASSFLVTCSFYSDLVLLPVLSQTFSNTQIKPNLCFPAHWTLNTIFNSQCFTPGLPSAVLRVIFPSNVPSADIQNAYSLVSLFAPQELRYR